MKELLKYLVPLALLMLGLVFITNTGLISWFPVPIHYIVGIILIIGAIFSFIKMK